MRIKSLVVCILVLLLQMFASAQGGPFSPNKPNLHHESAFAQASSVAKAMARQDGATRARNMESTKKLFSPPDAHALPYGAQPISHWSNIV